MLRSLLFTPANHERRVAKALSGPADGVILDLEDAVAEAEKPAARSALVEVLRERLQSGAAGGPEVFVRINALPTPHAHADLEAVVVEGVRGIVVPKVESASDLAIADWVVTQLERDRALPPGGLQLVPILESAAGLANIGRLGAVTPRVRRFAFGAGDFTLDTSMEWTSGNEGVLWGRVSVVIASRAAGLEAPLDTVYPDLRDMEGFRLEAEQGRRIGFQGKTCIHPAQVEIVNQVFSPTPAELEEARRIVDAFERAVAEGSASIQLDGRFIDYPIAERARRVVRSAPR